MSLLHEGGAFCRLSHAQASGPGLRKTGYSSVQKSGGQGKGRRDYRIHCYPFSEAGEIPVKTEQDGIVIGKITFPWSMKEMLFSILPVLRG